LYQLFSSIKDICLLAVMRREYRQMAKNSKNNIPKMGYLSL